MSIYLLLAIIWIHCIADFFLQYDYVAINKSTDVGCLMVHSVIYSLLFCIIGFEYAAINGMLHFIVDGISSQLTSHFWIKEERHWFFATIGVDQAAHMTCLILTVGYI